jgi:prolipoprotein diacylglyceryltransferase
MELTLLWAALTGAGAAWIALRLLAPRIPPTVSRPFDLLVSAAAGGLLCGRVAALLADGVNPLTHPFELLLVRGGVDPGFASLGALGLLLRLVGRPASPALDAVSPAVLAGLAGWHGGCLWRGACLGAASDLPWAWATAGSRVTRHPVELYAAALLVVGAVIVARLPRRPWQATGAALAWAGGARLLTEPLRVSISGGPVEWYAAALLAGAGLAVMAGLGWTRPRPAGNDSPVGD